MTTAEEMTTTTAQLYAEVRQAKRDAERAQLRADQLMRRFLATIKGPTPEQVRRHRIALAGGLENWLAGLPRL